MSPVMDYSHINATSLQNRSQNVLELGLNEVYPQMNGWLCLKLGLTPFVDVLWELQFTEKYSGCKWRKSLIPDLLFSMSDLTTAVSG